jgi:hypothetical protein
MSNKLIVDNAFIQSAIGEIFDLIKNSNLVILQCYKDLFKKEYFIKGIGGFIVITIMIVELVFSIKFFLYDMTLIRSYLYHLTQYFLMYFNNINKNIIKNARLITAYKNNKKPPKKIKKKKKKKINDESNKKILSKKIAYEEINSKSLNTCKSTVLMSLRKKSKNNLSKSSHLLKNKKAFTNIKDHDLLQKLKKEKEYCGNIDIEEYLKADFDDMEYDDAIKLDKRSFCVFFIDKLKSKQILMDTFCNKENLMPMSIKIILLALNIDLYFVVNGLFINEEYLAELFELDEEDSFFSFFPRSIGRFFYTTIVGIIVGIIIDCIIVEEKKIKRIFLREKDDAMQLKYEISLVVQSIKKRFTLFIILCFFITIISWYYVSCFNNTYPCVKMEWIKSSVAIMIIMNILSFFIVLLEAIIRSLSFYCKSEKLYKFRKFIS